MLPLAKLGVKGIVCVEKNEAENTHILMIIWCGSVADFSVLGSPYNATVVSKARGHKGYGIVAFKLVISINAVNRDVAV